MAFPLDKRDTKTESRQTLRREVIISEPIVQVADLPTR